MLESRLSSLKESSVEEIGAIYSFWRECWGEEFKGSGLVGIDTRNSDDFRNSDFVRSIWVGNALGSLMLVSKFDLSREWDRQCSYFNDWPKEFFEKVGNAKITALRYFLVSPAFRKSPRLHLGSSVISFCFKDFLLSDSDYLAGMTLKRYGAHNLTAKFGMEPVGPSGATKHGVEVEYMMVTKKMLNRTRVEEFTSGIFDNFQGRPREWGFENLDGVMGDDERSGLG